MIGPDFVFSVYLFSILTSAQSLCSIIVREHHGRFCRVTPTVILGSEYAIPIPENRCTIRSNTVACAPLFLNRPHDEAVRPSGAAQWVHARRAEAQAAPVVRRVRHSRPVIAVGRNVVQRAGRAAATARSGEEEGSSRLVLARVEVPPGTERAVDVELRRGRSVCSRGRKTGERVGGRYVESGRARVVNGLDDRFVGYVVSDIDLCIFCAPHVIVSGVAGTVIR